jgi:hypothetical protein
MERIGLDLDTVLTPYNPSVLYSASGKVAVAPVLGRKSNDEKDTRRESLQNFDWSNPTSVLGRVAQLLPPPLDVALLSEFSAASPLTVADRFSALGKDKPQLTFAIINL